MDEVSEIALNYTGVGETPDSVLETYFRNHEEFYHGISAVVDCGAGAGAFSLTCARRTDAKKVYAYDGHSANFSSLVENIRNNEMYSVVADDHHISGETARKVMSVSSGVVNLLDMGERILCETRSLDELVIPEFDLLRIAVPGDAIGILKGGERKIKKYEPSMIVESVSPKERTQIEHILEDFGYVEQSRVTANRIIGVESVFSFHAKP